MFMTKTYLHFKTAIVKLNIQSILFQGHPDPKSTGNGLKSRDNGDVMTENQYDQRFSVCDPKIIPG